MSENRYAVLIASSQFQDSNLHNLTCPVNDVTDFNEILTSKDYGNFSETLPLKNCDHFKIMQEMERVLKKASKYDLVLIYYSGHGKQDRAGKLHLATANTDISLLKSTSIPIESIKGFIDDSYVNNVIIILDCCYSGLAGDELSRGSVDEQLQSLSKTSGTYILTSSTSIQQSWESESENNGVFTKHLVEGIRSWGAANKNGDITMDGIYSYIQEQMKNDRKQIPMKWSLNVRAEMVLAHNSKLKVKSGIVENNARVSIPRYTLKQNFTHIPDRIRNLGDLAYNLWWSWHPEGRELFIMLGGRAAWSRNGHNPIKMLHELDEGVLKLASMDPRFLRHYDAVMAKFEGGLDPSSGWFSTNVANPKECKIAYFSAEYGLHHALPVYASGLGFLAGDYLKECSDLGVPIVGVGFMYPEGDLLQRITSEGWQAGACERLDRENAPVRKLLDENGDPLLVEIPALEKPIYVAVWKVQVGRADLYLMDTAVDANEPGDQIISNRLHTGDSEQKLRQDIVLGIGGVRVLKALGIEPSIIHLNEGQPAFAVLERLRERVEMGRRREEAEEVVKKTTLFTTHTLVPANQDKFSFQLMDKYFRTYLRLIGMSCEDFFKLGIDPRDPASGFDMTAFALRMSAYRNCVSKWHREVVTDIWRNFWSDDPNDEIPIDYVTNGIHVPTWIDRDLGNKIFNKYLGRGWLEEHDDSRIWELMDEIPDSVLWKHHRRMKLKLLNEIRERARKNWYSYNDPNPKTITPFGVMLNPNVLTIGFVHQFASYKRATLIFRDVERFRKILTDPYRPVQIIFAGKAHPDDQYGKILLQQILNVATDKDFGGRVAFVEDYDQYIAQYMLRGVDVWLNNPIPSMEACGTSGMMASLNGVPQISIFGGWWVEGYIGRNGWGFEGAKDLDESVRDDMDAATIYEILENEVVPLYYRVDDEGVPRGWVKLMKETIMVTGPHFTSRRMVKEYAEKFYKNMLKCSIL